MNSLPVGPGYGIQNMALTTFTKRWSVQRASIGICWPKMQRVCSTVEPDITNGLDDVITQLHRDLKDSALPDADSDAEITLVLDHSSTSEDQRLTCRYYFASHTHKQVFWLENFNLPCLSKECDVWSTSECKNALFTLKYRYEWPILSCRRWRTVLVSNDNLPNNNLELYDFAQEALRALSQHTWRHKGYHLWTPKYSSPSICRSLYYSVSRYGQWQLEADRATSKFSTSPYTVEVLSTMLELVKNIERMWLHATHFATLWTHWNFSSE